MALNRHQTMALFRTCNTFGANSSLVALRYVCPTEAARTQLEEQIERAMVTCPQLERKTPVVTFEEKPIGMDFINYDLNHCVLEARITFVPTARGLTNQQFTSADIQKLAGTMDAIGVINFNVKDELMKRSRTGVGGRTAGGKP